MNPGQPEPQELACASRGGSGGGVREVEGWKQDVGQERAIRNDTPPRSIEMCGWEIRWEVRRESPNTYTLQSQNQYRSALFQWEEMSGEGEGYTYNLSV